MRVSARIWPNGGRGLPPGWGRAWLMRCMGYGPPLCDVRACEFKATQPTGKIVATNAAALFHSLAPALPTSGDSETIV